MAGQEANPSAGSFGAAAVGGGFAVSPEVADIMGRAIDDALTNIDKAGLLLDNIKQGTPLGDSPAGRSMADHNISVAVGASSAEQVLAGLAAALEEHARAIRQAMVHYDEQDRHNAGPFG